MAVIDELVTLIGVDLDPKAKKNLDSFKAGVESAKKHVLALSAAATAFAGAAMVFVKGVSDECAQLETLSKETGVSTDKLQEWAFAADQAGVSASAVHGDLEKLNKSFVKSGKDADESLMAMSAQMQGMSAAAAKAYGEARGLSQDTINLLRQGPEELEKIRKKAHELGGIIPEDSIRMAAQFKRTLGELNFAFNGIKASLAIGMIPALARAADLVKRFTMENREFISAGISSIMTGIVNGFERFWKILTKVWDAFKPVRDIVSSFSGGMKLAEFVTHLVTGALTGLLMLFAPMLAKFALIGAAIAGVSFILEDLFMSIFQGKGFFADIFGPAVRWIKRVDETLGGFLTLAVKFIGIMAGALTGMMGLFMAFQKVKAGIAIVTTAFNVLKLALLANPFAVAAAAAIAAVVLIVQNWETIKAFFQRLWKTVTSYFPDFSGWAASAVEAVKAPWNALAGFFSGMWDAIAERFPDFAAWATGAKDAIVGIFGKAIGWVKEKLAALTGMLPDWLKKKIGLSVSASADDKPQEPTGAAADVKTVLDDSNGPSPARNATGPASVPSPPDGGGKTVQYNDNKTINQNIATSDPQQAGNAAASAISGQQPQTPGSWGQAT